MPKLLPMPKRAPKTLLQYVCERLLGPAHDTPELGVSYFYCPTCGSSRFHTLPHNPKYKDRYYCWSCGERGDAADLLKLCFPEEHYSRHLTRMALLEGEYHQLPQNRRVVIATATAAAGTAPCSLPGDSASWPGLVAESAERLWLPYQEPYLTTAGFVEVRQVPAHPVLAWLRRRGLVDPTIKAARLGASAQDNLLIPWTDCAGRHPRRQRPAVRRHGPAIPAAQGQPQGRAVPILER